MTTKSYFSQGIKDAVPTMLGYFPAALTFGLTGASIGLNPMEIFAISFFVYAGSAQFFILLALQLGMPVMNMVFFVLMLNLRHLLYGPLLEPYLPVGLKRRLGKAFFLTDEVFALAYLKLKTIPEQSRTPWYFAVGLFAWFSWLLGTLVGIFAGTFIVSAYPVLAMTMGFSLSALFVGVTFLVIQAPMLWALSLGSMVSLLFAYMDWTSVAILTGTVVACFVYQPPKLTTDGMGDGDA